MKQKVYLSLLILTLSTLIIIAGCGGSNNVTQTTSLFTPTPDVSGNMAYLTFRVKWPETGKAGNLIISSSGNDEKELTASMPPDAQKIKLKVFNYKDKNKNDPIDFDPNNLLAEGQLSRSDIIITLPIQIPIGVTINNPSEPNNPNKLPAIPVKVWAGCFTDPNEADPNSALSTAEHYMILKIGNQTANIDLGDYILTLTADPNTIILGGSSVSGSTLISNTVSIDATPTPGIVPAGTSDITANLSIKYPKDPNDPNSMPVYKPVPHKNIQFSLEGEGGNLSDASKETEEGTGNCTVTLTTTELGTKIITAQFQPDLNDPSIFYTATCDVNVTGNPDLELYNLILGYAPDSSNKFILIPDFQSNDYSLVDKVTLMAKLMKLDPNTFQFNIPVSKPVEFIVTDKGITDRITATTIDGYCPFEVSCGGDVTPRSIEVKALFQPDPNDETKNITATLAPEVDNNLIIGEDFEKYDPNTRSINGWESFYGPIVIAPGYSSDRAIRLGTNSFFYNHLYNTSPYEYRFAVKIGNEVLHDDIITRGRIQCNGLTKNNYLLPILIFKNKDKWIENCNEERLTNYSTGWIPIKIQINYDGYAKTAKIVYWINGVYYGSVNVDNVSISYSYEHYFIGLDLSCFAGSMCFDNIEIYSADGLIKKN